MTNQDLIRQYVDTGLPIPEYQFERLSSNLQKTYIRKRAIAIDLESEEPDFAEIPDYWEIVLLPENLVGRIRAKAEIWYDRKGFMPDFYIQFMEESKQRNFLKGRPFVNRKLYDKLNPENKGVCVPI